MRKVLVYSSIAVIVAACGSTAGYAVAKQSVSPPVCVQHGPKGSTSAAGNVMLWNFDHLPCPSGTYGINIGEQGPAGPVGPQGVSGVTFYDKPIAQAVQGNNLNINVECKAGDVAIGGGVVASDGQLTVAASGPSSTTGAWVIDVRNTVFPAGVSATFYAVCAHV